MDAHIHTHTYIHKYTHTYTIHSHTHTHPSIHPFTHLYMHTNTFSNTQRERERVLEINQTHYHHKCRHRSHPRPSTSHTARIPAVPTARLSPQCASLCLSTQPNAQHQALSCKNALISQRRPYPVCVCKSVPNSKYKSCITPHSIPSHPIPCHLIITQYLTMKPRVAAQPSFHIVLTKAMAAQKDRTWDGVEIGGVKENATQQKTLQQNIE